MGHVALPGYGLHRAIGHGKLLDFAGDQAALRLLLPGGHLHRVLASVMALVQAAGVWLGSHLVIWHGAALVRPVLVLTSLDLGQATSGSGMLNAG